MPWVRGIAVLLLGCLSAAQAQDLISLPAHVLQDGLATGMAFGNRTLARVSTALGTLPLPSLPGLPSLSIPPLPSISIPPLPNVRLPPLPNVNFPPLPSLSIPPLPNLSIPPLPALPRLPGVVPAVRAKFNASLRTTP
ncbi:formin-2-like [Thrips palmi]|uniref:Formin-2-like n=1 Tax=Thrips palmi TaxID=161013 RepID=A0A6P8Z1R9_THRPL|nr:formin-2-like [Thrips palmi]